MIFRAVYIVYCLCFSKLSVIGECHDVKSASKLKTKILRLCHFIPNLFNE